MTSNSNKKVALADSTTKIVSYIFMNLLYGKKLFIFFFLLTNNKSTSDYFRMFWTIVDIDSHVYEFDAIL